MMFWKICEGNGLHDEEIKYNVGWCPLCASIIDKKGLKDENEYLKKSLRQVANKESNPMWAWTRYKPSRKGVREAG
jgi:hypothetical protein